MKVSVRPAEPGDLPALVDLYNHYIETSPATFDLAPHTIDDRRPWFDAFAAAGRHRLLVAEVDGRGGTSSIAGFASSRQFRAKAAYDPSVESSVYVAHDALGRGIGDALYRELIPTLRAEPGVHRVLAGITLPNDASVSLHERFGFEQVGVFREVGFKFDRYWDVGWWQLDASSTAP